MVNTPGFFVTGTDTDVGKTVVSLGLMQLLQDQGLQVTGMKPVASGCERSPEGLRNADALQLQKQASDKPAYELVNPYAFEPSIAPHIAAAQSGVTIDVQKLLRDFQALSANADSVVVEGIGGWQVPLSEKESVADLARVLGLPVFLVVGIRLGCLNHALLTAGAIVADGVPLAGWVANIMSADVEAVDDNINTLKSMINAPLQGIIPILDEPGGRQVARHLTLP